VLHDHEAVVVLLQDGHELEGGKGAADLQRCDVAVQAAEDAGVVAADEEDLVALQFRVADEGAGQQLRWRDEDVEVSSSRETTGWGSISMIENR
jgi:hypothetical protein